MDITDEEVLEYKQLHVEEFAEVLSDANARKIASQLLFLYESLWQTFHDR
jgi:hypothetical protein